MAEPPPIVLNWRDSSHWSATKKPCRYCGRPTNLRDEARKPAEKVCAEAALTAQAAARKDAA